MAKALVKDPVTGAIIEVDTLTKAQASDLERRPKVLDALKKLSKNEDLANFLLDNHDKLVEAFDVGSIRRVTKGERKKLEDALEYIAEATKGSNKAAFVNDNRAAIVATFKWPGQTRVKPEEKAAAVFATINDLTEGNETVTKWIVDNEAAIFEAYDTGKVKREVPQSTKDALAAYQARMKAEKA